VSQFVDYISAYCREFDVSNRDRRKLLLHYTLIKATAMAAGTSTSGSIASGFQIGSGGVALLNDGRMICSRLARLLAPRNECLASRSPQSGSARARRCSCGYLSPQAKLPVHL
jgi:hypothetical protein